MTTSWTALAEDARLDAGRVLDALETLHSVESANDLVCWSGSLFRAVLPHDTAFFTCGVVRGERRWLREDIHRNCPVEYLEHFRQTDGLCLTPTMKLAFQTHRPQLFEPGMDARFTSAQLEAFRSFELRNILAYGWVNQDSGFATYVSVNRVSGPLRPWHARVLQLVTPQISFALARIRARERSDPAPEQRNLPRLTPKEIEILRLLPEGRSNFAIATILGRKELTVKKQLESIYRKLDVATRVQAAHWWTTVGRRHHDSDRSR